MWNVVICSNEEAERGQILEYVQHFARENGVEMLVQGSADWSELYELLCQEEPDIIIIAQDGVAGLDTITNIHLPPRKFIWYSDLEFAVQAYRMCVSWFGKKPVTCQKLEQALLRCMEVGSSIENRGGKIFERG